MAQIREVKLVDDLDGGEAHETINFALDGKQYEIDLSSDHAAALRENLDDYVKAARKASNGHSAPRPSRNGNGGARSATDREFTAAVRKWAGENGHTVADRGRIPKPVLEAYQAAH